MVGVRGMVGVRLARMTGEQFGPWLEEARAHYAQSIAASGVPAEEADRKATGTFARLLPDGLGSAGNHLWYAYDGDERVGFLWVLVEEKPTGNTAFVHDIAVEEGLRRKGYGRAIMLAAEQWCQDNGVIRIGLHVFAHNRGARRLYERLGFAETDLYLAKELPR